MDRHDSSTPTNTRPSARALVAIVLLAAVLTACSRHDSARNEAPLKKKPPARDPSALSAPPSEESPEAARLYGYGPRPGQHIVYQPDVILIGGGANAVRDVSDDGTTWTLDARARGTRELSVGKIMFATSRAVGRVAAIRPQGNDLAVTVAPVSLTEVIRDAKIDIDTRLPPEAFRVYVSDPPTPPAASVQPGVGGGTPMPAVWRPDVEPPILLPIGYKVTPKVSLGDWDLEGYFKASSRQWYESDAMFGSDPPKPGLDAENTESSSYGLKISRKVLKVKDKKRLKFGADLRLVGEDIRIRGHLSISGGQMDEPMTFVLEGIDALDLGVSSGVETGNDDNVKIRLEYPADWTLSIPEYPLAVHLKLKAYIETAFSSANSTMWASGQYTLDGPIGIENGTPVGPVLAVKVPMVNNIHGIQLGASGVVGAIEFRFMFGLGGNYFVAGPYSKITVAVGVSRGSMLAFGLGGPLSNPLRPRIDCRGVTLKIDAAGGLGVYIDSKWKPFLEKLKAKTDTELIEKSVTVYSHSVVQPQSAICQAN